MLVFSTVTNTMYQLSGSTFNTFNTHGFENSYWSCGGGSCLLSLVYLEKNRGTSKGTQPLETELKRGLSQNYS